MNPTPLKQWLSQPDRPTDGAAAAEAYNALPDRFGERYVTAHGLISAVGLDGADLVLGVLEAGAADRPSLRLTLDNLKTGQGVNVGDRVTRGTLSGMVQQVPPEHQAAMQGVVALLLALAEDHHGGDASAADVAAARASIAREAAVREAQEVLIAAQEAGAIAVDNADPIDRAAVRAAVLDVLDAWVAGETGEGE